GILNRAEDRATCPLQDRQIDFGPFFPWLACPCLATSQPFLAHHAFLRALTHAHTYLLLPIYTKQSYPYHSSPTGILSLSLSLSHTHTHTHTHTHRVVVTHMGRSDIPPPTTFSLKRCRSEDPSSLAELCSPPAPKQPFAHSSHLQLSILEDLESSLNAAPVVEAALTPEELVTEMMRSLEKVMVDKRELVPTLGCPRSPTANSQDLCSGYVDLGSLQEDGDMFGVGEGRAASLSADTEQNDAQWSFLDDYTEDFAASADLPNNKIDWLEEGCDLPAFSLAQIEEEGLLALATDNTELLLLDCYL
ncbi:hypothetical protein GOP47_0029589, partial [Adiantum capillus-veneris]